MISTRHEPVYHAAHSCQAASLSLTASRLRGFFWACQVESQKTARFFARFDKTQRHQKQLSSPTGVQLLGVLKGGRLIAAVMGPHRKDDANPDIGKSATATVWLFPSARFR